MSEPKHHASGFKHTFRSRERDVACCPGRAHMFRARYVLAPRLTMDLSASGERGQTVAFTGAVTVDFADPSDPNAAIDPGTWSKAFAHLVQPAEIETGQTFRGHGLVISIVTESCGKHKASLSLKVSRQTS